MKPRVLAADNTLLIIIQQQRQQPPTTSLGASPLHRNAALPSHHQWLISHTTSLPLDPQPHRQGSTSYFMVGLLALRLHKFCQLQTYKVGPPNVTICFQALSIVFSGINHQVGDMEPSFFPAITCLMRPLTIVMYIYHNWQLPGTLVITQLSDPWRGPHCIGLLSIPIKIAPRMKILGCLPALKVS